MSVVLTYLTPAVIGGPTLGGTVPPTAKEAQYLNELSVKAWAQDSDTSIVVVHNWGLSTEEIAAGFPLVNVRLLTAGTDVPLFTAWSSAADAVTITKANAAGSGGTVILDLLRPHTIIR